MQQDPRILGTALRRGMSWQTVLQTIPTDLWSQNDFVFQFLYEYPDAAPLIMEKLKPNTSWVLQLVQHSTLAYEFLPEEFKNDPEICAAVIQINVELFEKMPDDTHRKKSRFQPCD
jgi:hypothetical protein